MYQIVGLQDLEITKVSNHLSSAATGIKMHGMTLDALTNGLIEGFQGKALTEHAAGAYVIAATAGQAMVKNKTYVIENANQNLFVATSDCSGVGAPDFATGAGLPDASASNHSVFRVLCKDETSSVVGPVAVIDQGDLLWIPPSANFKFGFEVAAWANRTQLRTMVMTQIGVCGALHANKLLLESAAMDDGTNPISGGNFIYVEVAQGKIRLVHGNGTTAPTLGSQMDVPTGAFTVVVEYIASTNQAHIYVDQKWMGVETLSALSTASAMQFFLRAGNSKGYVQATHSPCDISIDAIVVSSPRS